MVRLIAEGWGKILSSNGLESFDDFWELELEALDHPNSRRAGRSSTSRLELVRPGGQKVTVHLKRQEDHVRRKFLRRLAGIPTL